MLGIEFQPNVNNNRGDISWTSGYLTRVVESDEDERSEWTIPSGSETSLTISFPNYIYARCHKTLDSASIQFSTTRPTYDDGSYYNLELGVYDTTQSPAVISNFIWFHIH